MQVSEYNKGRTVADVSNKDYIDGTRKYLRPDTMWADERYSQVTQAEIDQAKQRVAERAKANPPVQQEEQQYVPHKGGRAYIHSKPLYP